MSENVQGSTPSEKGTFDLRVEVYDWAQALVGAVVFVVLLFALALSMFSVDGASMDPTLHDKQRLLISNWFYTPASGDIIMFTKKGVHVTGADPDRDAPLVKRVIAVEGQTVRIDVDAGTVYVDGQALDEPYTAEALRSRGDWLPAGEVVVPEGHVFVLGDNRNASSDSRSSMIGMVDRRYILGRVLLRILPFDKFGTVR